MHQLKAEVRTIEDIRPSVHNPALRINHGLVEVEPIQVERHRADAQGGKPDADDRPCAQEEVQRTAVVEAGVLEDQRD